MQFLHIRGRYRNFPLGHTPRIHLRARSNLRKKYPGMTRTLEMKRTTAIDARAYLRTVDSPPEGIMCLLTVLDVSIADFDRAIKKHAISERFYYRLRAAQATAAVLLEDLLQDYLAALKNFDVTMTPVNIVELGFIVLNDALDQITGSLLYGQSKGFQPMMEHEMKALQKIGIF
jgi:hypothetical protein